MTEPKLRKLHKLLREFSIEMERGELFVDPPNVARDTDKQEYGAEVVDLVKTWVWRMIP